MPRFTDYLLWYSAIAIWIITPILALLLSGCSLIEVRTTSDTSGEAVLTGDAAGIPVNLKFKHASRTTEQSATTSPAAGAAVEGGLSLASLLLGPGFLGAAGLAVKGFMSARSAKREADEEAQAHKQTVAAVDDLKGRLADKVPDAKTIIRTTMLEHQDKATQRRVAKHRGKV